MSPWLYQCSAIKEVLLCWFSKPQYEPTALLREIQRRHNMLTDLGITPFYVFDGSRHPMKVVARQSRDKKLASARDYLNSFLEKGRRGDPITDDDRKRALKNIRDTFIPDQKIIHMVVTWMKQDSILHMSAPFEAEWQLIELERSGEIHAIIGIDSDLVPLGGSKILVDVKFNQRTPSCHLFERDVDLFEGPFGESLRLYENNLPEIASFLGCDYVKKANRVGLKTLFTSYIPEFFATQAEDRKAFLDKRNIDGTQFLKSVNLFRHCPVLRKICDAELSNNFDLVPLNALAPSTNSPSQWAILIGFDPTSLLKMPPDQYADAAHFLTSSFQHPDGQPLDAFDIPTYSQQENASVPVGTRLPNFARIDFEAIPMPCVPGDMLTQFASARGIDTTLFDSREGLEKAIREYLHGPSSTCLIHPDDVPTQIDRWVAAEVLDPIEGEDWKDYYEAITTLARIDDSIIKEYYPMGNEHNRYRAFLLFQGGNLLVRETMAVRLCTDKQKSQKLLVRCDCIPSMKTEVRSENIDDMRARNGYVVFLCFEYDTNKSQEDRKPLSYPYSCCGCYDGRTMCSHLLALLSVCFKAQTEAMKGADKTSFEQHLTQPPHNIQNEPIRIENIIRADGFARSKGQLKFRKYKKA